MEFLLDLFDALKFKFAKAMDIPFHQNIMILLYCLYKQSEILHDTYSTIFTMRSKLSGRLMRNWEAQTNACASDAPVSSSLIPASVFWDFENCQIPKSN